MKVLVMLVLLALAQVIQGERPVLPARERAEGQRVAGRREPARVKALWNEFTAETARETDADLNLMKSLKDFDPQLLAGGYGPRLALYDEAIARSQARTRLLEGMREAEYGERR